MGFWDNLQNLTGKDVIIDGKDYHVGAGNNKTGLSGWFKQDNGNQFHQHIGMDKIEQLRREEQNR